MGRGRSVADEIRRVVARLGGAPATHGVPPPHAGAHALDRPPVGIHAAAVAVAVRVERPASPGTGVAALRVAAPRARINPGVAPLRCHVGEAGRGIVPPRSRAVEVRPVPVAHAAGGGTDPPPVEAAALLVGRARPGPPRLSGAARAGRCAPLPRRVPARHARRTPPRLLVLRRRRAAWDTMARERLATAWRRLLHEHRLPADELRLVGVFGPLPLGLVEAVALEPDGTLLVTMRRRALAGAAGDVAVARHEPTGRLLRTLSPAGPPAGGLRTRVH